jgi:hypothetical protein
MKFAAKKLSELKNHLVYAEMLSAEGPTAREERRSDAAV